ncbi:hypothetical protein A2U01_0005720 [Trifolium medium]|uniref:Uncharacterized protein n=1 Tax=Trifolium medium TaxID=97028 RepID=A0A392MCK2_9FABA|nr:hypothetical protein [Trifolium medium]
MIQKPILKSQEVVAAVVDSDVFLECEEDDGGDEKADECSSKVDDGIVVDVGWVDDTHYGVNSCDE